MQIRAGRRRLPQGRGPVKREEARAGDGRDRSVKVWNPTGMESCWTQGRGKRDGLGVMPRIWSN